MRASFKEKDGIFFDTDFADYTPVPSAGATPEE
jgi:hypothetical protein